MKSVTLLLALATPLVSSVPLDVNNKSNALRSSDNLSRSEIISSDAALSTRDKPKPTDNWGNALEHDRKKVTIRPSKHDRDDISDEFLAAIKKANNGGLVHLKKGHTYIIGKKLDLTFLKDVYVKIDGELKVPSCDLVLQ
jgi:galacturan 1,4-alpha-galacturonidase